MDCRFIHPKRFQSYLIKILIYRCSELGRKQLLAMSPIPELKEFLRDSLEDASMLNRYVIDTSSCLIYQKVWY